MKQSSLKYCEAILPKVSRTFALNIVQLKGDLYRAVLCGYLFCRLLDTVEDTIELPFLTKKDAFQTWINAFPFKNSPNNLDFLIKILKSPGKALTHVPEETELITHCRKIFEVFYALPQSYQEAMTPPILEMAKGMLQFQSKFNENDFFQIESISELDHYCYFVAGTVGELLTNLFLLEMPYLTEAEKVILNDNAVAFGLGLQITNIVKDVVQDSERNFFFMPSDVLDKHNITKETFLKEPQRPESIAATCDLVNHANTFLDRALDYCLALPKKATSIRKFCFIPLHLAIESLLKVVESYKVGETRDIKISRLSVYRTLFLTQIFSCTNKPQKYFYESFSSKIKKATHES